MTSVLGLIGSSLLLFGFQAEVRRKMRKFSIGELGAKPAYCHPQFAGQKEFKFDPTVLL